MSWNEHFAALREELLAHLQWPASSLQDYRNHPLEDDSIFSDLALRIFRFQLRHNKFYAAYCAAKLGHHVPNHWREIPCLWSTAYKRGRVACFPRHARRQFFQTSGTTEKEKGIHEFCTLELYDCGAQNFFRLALMPDRRRMVMLMLTPSPREVPHSSLVHMLERIRRTFGAPGSDYFVRNDALDAAKLIERLRRTVRQKEPVFLLGTAFAFVHLLDFMAARGLKFELPEGSRLMETGGFKGRTREIPREEFYRQLSAALGLPESHIVNEYGMTELSSQFYDATLASAASRKSSPKADRRYKVRPPWTRVLIVDPLGGEEMPLGERGLVRIYDLANLGSVVALQTEDVGVRSREGFEVLGRARSAPLRGCSLDAEYLETGERELWPSRHL